MNPKNVTKTDIGHLQTECKLLDVKQHNELLSRQFHLGTKQSNHPNYSIPFIQPPRTMKHNLATRYENDIAPLFSVNGNSETQHKIGLRDLHQIDISSTPVFSDVFSEPDIYGPQCPKCCDEPHNTHHLFACPEDPATLTPLRPVVKSVGSGHLLGTGDKR